MKLKPGDHIFRPIQPALSETEGLGVKSNERHSNGWVGVLSWCASAVSGMSIEKFLDETKIDFLVIQLDAEVAFEPSINCARPCPDAEDTVLELEQIILSNLKEAAFSSRIICCVPSYNTEAWVLTGLDTDMLYHGNHKYIECEWKPDEIVSKPPFRAIKRKAGKAKKSQSEYRLKCVPVVLDRWDYIRQYCSQAEKFHQRIMQL